MTEAEALQILSDAIWVAARIAAPILLTAVSVGVAIGLVQSVTQIQEQTLTFVPKFAAVGAVIILSGSWMMAEMVGFTRQLWETVPTLIGLIQLLPFVV